MTCRPSVWCSKYYFFFIKSCKILCKNPFNLFFYFFYKITKMKIKSFECPKSIRNYEKNTWNIRRLVDESFVPYAQQTSVLYCRLSDLRPYCIHISGDFKKVFAQLWQIDLIRTSQQNSEHVKFESYWRILLHIHYLHTRFWEMSAMYRLIHKKTVNDICLGSFEYL